MYHYIREAESLLGCCMASVWSTYHLQLCYSRQRDRLSVNTMPRFLRGHSRTFGKANLQKISQSIIYDACTLVRLYKWTRDHASDFPCIIFFSQFLRDLGHSNTLFLFLLNYKKIKKINWNDICKDFCKKFWKKKQVLEHQTLGTMYKWTSVQA